MYSNNNKVNSESDSFSSRNQFKNVRESELNKNTYYNRNMYDNVNKNVNKDTWVNYQTTTPSQVQCYLLEYSLINAFCSDLYEDITYTSYPLDIAKINGGTIEFT